jgi:UDP:flavonoid glycosyltransferase YjiC (YdhE family)
VIALKKIMFFLHPRISHINPIKKIITRLSIKNEVIIVTDEVISDFVNVSFPGNIRIYFTHYGNEDFYKKATSSYVTPDQIIDNWSLFFKMQANYNKTTNNKIHSIIVKYDPDVIIRDSMDIHSYLAAKKLNIPNLTFLTNNLFSLDFLFQDIQNFQLYFGLEKEPTLPLNITKKIQKKQLLDGFRKFKKESGLENSVYPFFQQAPIEDHTIICTSRLLQPENENSTYYLLPKDQTSFTDEVLPQKKLEEFLHTDKTKVYIATGSYMVFGTEYYTDTIDFFLRKKCRVLLSIQGPTIQVLKEIYIKKPNVFISDFLPQNYVLKYVDLFVSSGGLNSIYESIYHQTPMLIRPETGEQALNGSIIEKLGIGITTCNCRNYNFSLSDYLNLSFYFLEIYKENIINVSQELIQEVIEYPEIEDKIIKKIEDILW